MISLVLVPNMLAPSEGRVVTRVPCQPSARVIDYLPPEVAQDPAARRCVWVSLDGGYVPPEQWNATRVRDGSWIGCAIRPGDPFTVAFAVVTTIISAWQIYDATRRAKIQGHHASRRAAAAAAAMGDSVTYGWGGLSNTVNPGGPIQILYGRRRIAGQIILGWPQNDGTIDLKVAIGEGEVEGLVAGSVEINGKPIAKYPNVTVASRNGTLVQTALNIYGGASLVTPGNTVSNLVSPGGVNAGSYWWGNGTRWDGTGALIAITGGTQTKPTGNGSGGTKGTIDAYEVGIGINKGATVFNRAVNGYVQFHLDVEHRTPQGAGGFTAAGTMISSVARVVNGTLASVLLFSFRSSILALGDYDVRVTLNTGTTVVVADDGAAIALGGANFMVLQYLKEYRTFARIHPGLAYLGIEGLSAAAVGGMLPTVTSIWEGRKIADITSVGPPAVFSTEEYLDPAILGYTRGENPSLIMLDVFRTTRYGAGDFIDPDNDLQVQSFVDQRDFCDGLVSRGLNANDPIKSGTGDGTSTVATDDFTVAGQAFNDGTVKVDDTLEILTGADAGIFRIGAIDSATQLSVTTSTPPFVAVSFAGAAAQDWEIRNSERRCLVDYYFDGVTTIWKAIEALAVPNRLAVVRSNGKVTLVADSDGSPVQLFTQANVEDFKIQYMGKILANRVEVQFPDEEKNWEQSVAQFEDPDALVNREGIVRTEIEAFPITRRSHATRLAKYHWFSNRREPHQVSFIADARSLTVQYGDVIHAQRDEAPRSQQPELPGGVVRSVSGLTVLLDDWFTFPSSGGDRFKLHRNDTDAEHVLTIPVAFQDVKIDRITFAGFSGYTPVVGDPWVQEEALVDEQVPQFYKVVSITRSEDHRRRVRAVTYDQDVYLDNPIAGTTSVDTIELSEIDP